MPLYLTHVLRPLTIRFTEPGVADLSLDLNSFTHVRTSTDIHDPDDAVPVDPVLFDVVVEQNAHPQRKHSVGSDAKRSREQRARALIEARAQETVRDVKRIVRSDRPAIHRRRIRLIHAGRILRDGIRLVSYFDQLDSHRKASVRSLGSSLALGDDDNDGEDRAEDDEDGHAARTTTEVVPLRELLPDYWQSLPNSSGGGKGKGKAKASSDDDDDDDGDVSGGEDGSGDLGGVQVCVARKLHERIYVQCSVGDVMDSEEEARERGLIDVAPSSPPHLDIDDTGPSPSSADQDRSAPPAQGFDRLLSTGLTPEEVASIRAQFRSSALPVSGDVLRQREEEEHARALEDAWFDSFSQDPAASVTGSANGRSGAYQTVLEGLMVGFFLPLLPLFFFREGAWPSAFPSETAAAGRIVNPSRAGGELNEEDEEHDEEDMNMVHARNVTLSKGMQIAVVCGLFANLIMGAFRMLW